jgi:hypothetical protein
VENLKGRDRFGDLDIDEMILLTCMLKIRDMRMWTPFIWLSIGTSGSTCKNDYEPLVSIKDRQFLD